VVELAAGQQVYAQGDTGSRFYIIKEGSVTCTKTTKPSKPPAVFTLTAGQFFGERALLKDEIRHAVAHCLLDCASSHSALMVLCYRSIQAVTHAWAIQKLATRAAWPA